MGTRDIADRPQQTRLSTQKPGTLLMYGDGIISISEIFIDARIHPCDRRGGVGTYREAVELRIGAWPGPQEASGLHRKRNLAAMETLNLAFVMFSP